MIDDVPYLSPETPRWNPDNEAALVAAAAQGLLQESHYLEIKEAIPPPTKGNNRELARDLASFAVDGGTLLIGIREHKDQSPELVPVDLAGLPERVEQVARAVPDPPLPVTCTPIAAADQPGHGYLLVQVPATGTAPHMVDGAYMGRGDKTKHKLSDAEVLRLHHARDRAEDSIVQLVEDYVKRDPIPAEHRRQAHLFIVAAPARPRPEMLLAARPNGSWGTLLRGLVDRGTAGAGQLAESFSPNLRSVSELGRRPDGAALTYRLAETRQIGSVSDRSFEDVVELEASEDGQIRLLHTRVSDTDSKGRLVLFEDVLPHLVRNVVSIVAHVSDLTGYQGQWALGFAMNGIAGLAPEGARRAMNPSLGTIGASTHEYRRSITASVIELQRTPGSVTERLTGQFVRSIGFENDPTIKSLLSDPI